MLASSPRGGGGGCSRCSHKFAIMQMPHSSRARRLTLGSLLYGIGGRIVNVTERMQRDARLEVSPRKRERELDRALLSAAPLSFVILSAGSYARNLFRIIIRHRGTIIR